MNKNIFVVIPAYQPNEKLLLPLVEELVKDFPHIILVDDGGGNQYKSTFDKCKELGATVLVHYKNYGKGRGLKTALNYILSTYDEIDAIVTADSDGQHSKEDIEKVAEAVMAHPEAYVLGCRDFDDDSVPGKSKFGNKTTRNVFRIFVGLNITDTQTGLRGMSKQVASDLLAVAGERYEYETNALIACKEYDIPLFEVPIQTIYIDNNSESHFNPLRDSMMIYKLFLKYIFASVSSFLIDLALFTFFYKVIFKGNADAAFISTIIARILSSLYNFFINSKLVFKKMNQSSLLKYFILVVVQMFISAFVVNILSKLNPNMTIWIKVIVDTVIFIANFVIQREFVFKNKK